MKFFKEDYNEEKDPEPRSKEWPWSLPRSVMRARYGERAGDPAIPQEALERYQKPSGRPVDECDPIPIYLMECKKLGKKPDRNMIEILEKLWSTFTKRNWR